MVQVVLTSTLANRYSGGETHLDVSATSVRELLRLLNESYPGLGSEIENAQLLAIDGEIFQQAFLQKLKPGAEVFVLPKIGGG